VRPTHQERGAVRTLHDSLRGSRPWRFCGRVIPGFGGGVCFKFIEGDGAVAVVELEEADLAVGLGDCHPAVYIEQAATIKGKHYLIQLLLERRAETEKAKLAKFQGQAFLKNHIMGSLYINDLSYDELSYNVLLLLHKFY
jgi:hypothetical protein